MVKYNLYDRKTQLRDCPSSLDILSSQKIVIGYGRWGDSKHFHRRLSWIKSLSLTS